MIVTTDNQKFLKNPCTANLKILNKDIKALVGLMKLDKKNKSTKITFSLPKKIGIMQKKKGSFSVEINESLIKTSIKEVLDEFKN